MSHRDVHDVSVTEEILRTIWSQDLNTKHTSISDSFVGGGGTLQSAEKCVERVREAFGFELPLWVLMNGTPLSTITALIDRLVSSPERDIIVDYSMLRCLPDARQ